MGILIYISEWKKKKAEELELKKRRSFNPLAFGKSTKQKIKEAMAKFGSHSKNKNNSLKKDD